MKIRPFDLEEAIAGSACWNKDLTVFATYGFDIESEGGQSFHVFRAESTGSSFALFADNAGMAYSSIPGERLPQYDLFMKMNEVDYWVATAVVLMQDDTECIISSEPDKNEYNAQGALMQRFKSDRNMLEMSEIQTHKITRYE